ncbi:hypothetical protein SY83_07795 [Paenibacillus swuensis]|uniref:YncI copper-binding domain-containing protein n=1 Tax=Paenibacillus swuensis TaxID=1178515 RepID=A0A172TGQ2_9BACL|nr:YcnI family protein [Paenibacillus swuensis]ANE46190.1 hypothetical protein SY83_07795 [Paenibacillus swuensis]
MKKFSSMFMLCMTAMLVLVSAASAHVTVMPKETSQNAYEVFTVRVPNEAETATVKVEVKFPVGVDVSRFESKPGWTYESKKEGEKLTSVMWTAKEGGVKPGEFAEFRMQGKVGADTTELAWKAYQTYEDGTLVEWVGAPDADKPASVTTVKAAAAGEEHHGAAAPAAETDAAAGHEAAEAGEASNVPLILSIASLVVALAALGLALRKRA